MDADLEANRRGLLSAAQHARLSGLPGAASWGTKHVRAQMPGGQSVAALVGKLPDGLADDLDGRQVVGVDATIIREPSWMARLDDGGTLGLAPGVNLPPGRQRLYYLPRSRWVIHGEPRPEQWQDYRALVLQAQRLEPAEVEALGLGRLPPRLAARLRARERVAWVPVSLLPVWVIVNSATGKILSVEILLFTAFLGLIGWWAARRLAQVYRDTRRGALNFVDGPVHVHIVIGRHQAAHTLVVDGVRFALPSSDAELIPALQEGIPCRLHYAPTCGLFVAIEPMIGLPGRIG